MYFIYADAKSIDLFGFYKKFFKIFTEKY